MFPACIAHCDAFCVCLITSPLASAPETSVQPTNAPPTNAPHVYESFVAIFPPRDQREFLRPPLTGLIYARLGQNRTRLMKTEPRRRNALCAAGLRVFRKRTPEVFHCVAGAAALRF